MSLDIHTCEQARLSRDARFDGKFYTAVLTTGIFCRPICPARPPKPENVKYYLSAEQAQQQGFVPCKRCFPELAPGKTLPTTLNKILNAFDYHDDNLTTLANKFSISTRQLHRLVKQHLGISPSEYFQHQRLLLARKLIRTTELPFSDICFASGFKSIRRFNEAIKQQYNCTPNALRKQSDVTPNKCIDIQLPYRPPFDWPLMLSFFQYRQIQGMEHITDSFYMRNITIENCTGWLKVSHHTSRHALILKLSLSDYRYLNQIIQRVRKMFDLDADMSLIHDALATTPVLASVIARSPGLRLPGCWDILEFSIRAILGQQISVKAATTLAMRIVKQYGEKNAQLPDEVGFSFPTLDIIQQADFNHIGLTQSRKDTLYTWLNFFEQNKDIFETYQSLEQLEKQLCALKGIGPWTVNYIAMRGLSDPDAFPSADLGIIKALTDDQKKPTNKTILALAESWRPWRAYAAIYLWHSLAQKD
ncbi:DNA-3-methyladenine glycosylase 2 family protein [Thalassotalea sediminis]|uniref:DNA-3-methyladenine glycosylase 2 family protein n=1 Tax=Thalassotalea sediminis TaxID=1759089 RepID=UPI002573AB6E|nr:DNA-3-methyladenine glycosylase 2 [Thalassotalea sediminis]